MIYIFSNKNRCKSFFALILLLTLFLFFSVYTENFAADNISYFEISHCNVELYTRQRDPEIEKKIEKTLNKHEIYWDRMCSYIESESLYQTTYEIEV